MSLFNRLCFPLRRNTRKLALQVFQKQQKITKRVLIDELKACCSTKNLKRGKQAHAEATENGLDSCTYVANSLVHMYAKCGSMLDARQVFDSIKNPTVVSWNSLISGYAGNGEELTALDLFSKMRSQAYSPDSLTFIAALKACTSLALYQDGTGRTACLEIGKRIHLEIGLHMDIYVQCTLIDLYAKCGSMVDARLVFDNIKNPNVVTWNALILGYASNGEANTALDLFGKMRYQGCEPNPRTFLGAIKACTCLAMEQDGLGRARCLDRGRKIHLEIGCQSDDYVLSIVIDMYAKCGSMVEARRVFDSARKPDVVTWNALLLGYVENGEAVTVLDLFSTMKSQGCAPTSVTFVAVFKACSLLGALQPGIKIHTEIHIETLNVVLVTCLVEFYAKCGSLVEAQHIFDSHPRKRDLKSWTALLTGYSRVGDNDAVFRLYEQMQDAGVKPNAVTFLCILTCCSYAGLVEKAKDFFEAMPTSYKIAPSADHYTCMVDMLARLNKLDDSVALLRIMPFRPIGVTWKTVLGACCKWKNVGVGRLAFMSLVSLDYSDAAAYVLMGHIYGSRGMWEEQEMVLRLTI